MVAGSRGGPRGRPSGGPETWKGQTPHVCIASARGAGGFGAEDYRGGALGGREDVEVLRAGGGLGSWGTHGGGGMEERRYWMSPLRCRMQRSRTAYVPIYVPVDVAALCCTYTCTVHTYIPAQ